MYIMNVSYSRPCNAIHIGCCLIVVTLFAERFISCSILYPLRIGMCLGHLHFSLVLV